MEEGEEAQKEKMSAMSRESKEEELWLACSNGHVERVRELLMDPSIDLTWGDPQFQRSSFYRACFFGHKEIVEMFLQHGNGFDATQRQNQGCTPFFIACQEGYVEIVKLLMRHPLVDVNQPDYELASPLFMASQENSVSVVAFLLDYAAVLLAKQPELDALPLQEREWQEKAQNLKLVDVNSQTDQGATPLYIACEAKNLEIVKLLLEDPRTDVNLCDYENCSPLWAASFEGEYDIVKYLLSEGKDIETIIHNGADKRIDNLVAAFEKNPQKVRWELKRELGILDRDVARVFAIVTLFLNDYLTPKSRESFKTFMQLGLRENFVKFLRIMKQLPLELQMVTCNRLFGLPTDLVATKNLEPALRSILKRYYLPLIDPSELLV